MGPVRQKLVGRYHEPGCLWHAAHLESLNAAVTMAAFHPWFVYGRRRDCCLLLARPRWQNLKAAAATMSGRIAYAPHLMDTPWPQVVVRLLPREKIGPALTSAGFRMSGGEVDR